MYTGMSSAKRLVTAAISLASSTCHLPRPLAMLLGCATQHDGHGAELIRENTEGHDFPGETRIRVIHVLHVLKPTTKSVGGQKNNTTQSKRNRQLSAPNSFPADAKKTPPTRSLPFSQVPERLAPKCTRTLHHVVLLLLSTGSPVKNCTIFVNPYKNIPTSAESYICKPAQQKKTVPDTKYPFKTKTREPQISPCFAFSLLLLFVSFAFLVSSLVELSQIGVRKGNATPTTTL